MKSEKNKVLIIGGAGFVGKAIIRDLLNKGFCLLVMDVIEKPSSLPLLSQSFQWMKFCYLEAVDRKDELSTVIKENNISTVIHLATTLFPAESKMQIEKDCFENVYANVCLFKILYELGCDKIIFASSGGTVYGQSDCHFHEDDKLNPTISYGMSKANTESYLLFLANSLGKKSISLRISNPYGEDQRIEGNQGVVPIFLNKISKGMPLKVVGSIESKRDYIYIDDLVSAFFAAIGYEGKENVFNIGSGESVSLRGLIKILEKGLNNKSTLKYIEQKNNSSLGVSLNIDRAKRCLNWEPEVGFEAGVEKIIKYHGLRAHE